MIPSLELSLEQYSAIVVDDESLPCEYLVRLLQEAGVGRILQAKDGKECLALMAAEEHPLDWAFLDIQMPGLGGMMLADLLSENSTAQAQKTPSVVFVTGYEDYAVQAFDHAAVDYLLKPVERARLAVTLRRLVDRPMNPPGSRVSPPISSLRRIPIRLDYAVRLIDTADIIAANAHDKRVDIITRETTYRTNYTLTELEQRLPPDFFVRAHDSWIVNLSEVLEIHNLGSQTYQLRLHTREMMVPVSRRRLTVIQQRLGL